MDKPATLWTANTTQAADALSASAAAVALGVSQRTIRRAIARGDLPAVKRAGVYRIIPADVERYDERRRRSRPSEPPLIALARQAGEPPPMPLPRTPLIGRERELAFLRDLITRDEVPLVTLTGPGGVGKTRLALALAGAVAVVFPDGVHFVPLASIRDPDLVLPTIVRVLGLTEDAAQPSVARLIGVLRARRLLLVLDNFEHVLDAAPALAEVLAACPNLQVLATSRARLRLSEEQEVSVAPLALPARSGFDVVAAAPAAQLFVARAHAVDPAFALTTGNAASVAAICARLDGLPLAIELAAARTTLFAPEALLPQLARRLYLLTDGPRDAPARLRTMRDAIAWSHDLLDEPERALFRRLAVFEGGFDLAGASAIAGDGARRDPIENLAVLIDQSLVRRDDETGSSARFTMLETVREFAWEQLVSSGEEAELRDAHAQRFLALAEAADGALAGPAQMVWFLRLEAELPNLRAALRQLRDGGDLVASLRLATALRWFWFRRARGGEGRRQLEELLADPELAAGTILRIRALTAAGDLATSLGAFDDGVLRCEAALVLARGIGDEHGVADALRGLGNAALNRGDLRRADALLAESAARFAALGATWDAAMAVNWRGVAAYAQGDYAAAEECFSAAEIALERVGDAAFANWMRGNRGWVALCRGNLTDARAAFARSLEVALALGDRWWTAWCVMGAAGLAGTGGRAARAGRLFAAAAAMRAALDDPLRPSVQLRHDRFVAAARAALGEERFAAAWALGQAMTSDQAAAEAREELAAAGRPSAPMSRALSPRELEVVRLVAGGAADKDIAAALSIGRRTVTTHLSHIFAKLGVENRAEAAALAVRLGLL